MTPDIDLNELEKKSWKSMFRDGLHEIVFGVLLLLFAFAPIIRQHIGLRYIPFVIIPAPLIVIFGKMLFTSPRTGIAKFGTKRKTTHTKMVRISLAAFVVTFTLFVLTMKKIFPGFLTAFLGGYAVDVGSGITALVILCFFARMLDFPRLYIYGILIGLGIPFSALLHSTIGYPLDFLIAFGIPGVIVVMFGIRMLNNFLRRIRCRLRRMKTMTESAREHRNQQPNGSIDRLIHEPARYLIMANLYVIESADFLFLLRQTELTRGNLSSHMNKLENTGYIEIIKEFVNKKPHTMLRLTKKGRKAFEQYRENMKQILDTLPE